MSRNSKKSEKQIEPESQPQQQPQEAAKEESAAKSDAKDDKKPSTSDWNLGMFSNNPASGGQGGQQQQQGQGRPIGGEPEGPDTKLLLYGALGFLAFVGSIAFFEMGYKEISWKDFVNK